MTDLNKLRSEFEGTPEIKEMLKNNDELRWCVESNRYINHRVFQDAETGFINGAWFLFERRAKAQAVPEWISVDVKLPEIADASVLAHFQNGSIETVHIEDWFKDITSGFDEAGNQTFTKWYLKASNTITHWMPLPEAPIETGA